MQRLMIATRLGWEAEVRFLGDLADGTFAVEPLHAGDPVRMAELVATYRDLPLGSVDASLEPGSSASDFRGPSDGPISRYLASPHTNSQSS